MKVRLVSATTIALLLVLPLSAHRLDEYLQATIISISADRANFSMRLVPGVAVYPAVLALIDTNHDGVIAPSEQLAYALRVLSDLSLTIDSAHVTPQLVSVTSSPLDRLQDGMGAIQIEFTVKLPAHTATRKLVLENHHQTRIAAYLVNCLSPTDSSIRVVTQQRNESQSFYELDYVQAGPTQPITWSVAVREHARAFSTALGGFGSMFRLGMRHIAEGTDHLLFLLALLLPAPLLVATGRWGSFSGVRPSLLQILRVVTAFTIGHSITLALAAFRVLRVPAQPIEVLIAVSILISAIHAVRPLFPGWEPSIAAFFGLIHGLAFATTLDGLGVDGSALLANLLAFNVGIETMQLIVVAATLPSLLLLSRMRAYTLVRLGAAGFAGLASMGWIVERVLSVDSSVDLVGNTVARHAIWIVAALLLGAVLSCSLHGKVLIRQS